MNTLQTYAMFKAKIKDLQDRCKELEPAISEEIKQNEEPIKTDYGTFSMSVRKTITYSRSLQKKIDDLEKEKEIEVIKGKVKITEKESMRFMPAKYAIPPGMIDWDKIKPLKINTSIQ